MDVLPSLVSGSILISSASSSSTVCVSTSSEVARAESVPGTGECDERLVLMVDRVVEWNLGRLRLLVLLLRTGETKGQGTPQR